MRQEFVQLVLFTQVKVLQYQEGASRFHFFLELAARRFARQVESEREQHGYCACGQARDGGCTSGAPTGIHALQKTFQRVARTENL